MRRLQLAPNEWLAQAGAPMKGLYLLIDGEVKCLEPTIERFTWKSSKLAWRRRRLGGNRQPVTSGPRPDPRRLCMLPSLQPLRESTPRGSGHPKGVEISRLGRGQLVGDLELEASVGPSISSTMRTTRWQHSYVAVGALTCYYIDVDAFQRLLSWNSALTTRCRIKDEVQLKQAWRQARKEEKDSPTAAAQPRVEPPVPPHFSRTISHEAPSLTASTIDSGKHGNRNDTAAQPGTARANEGAATGEPCAEPSSSKSLSTSARSSPTGGYLEDRFGASSAVVLPAVLPRLAQQELEHQQDDDTREAVCGSDSSNIPTPPSCARNSARVPVELGVSYAVIFENATRRGVRKVGDGYRNGDECDAGSHSNGANIWANLSRRHETTRGEATAARPAPPLPWSTYSCIHSISSLHLYTSSLCLSSPIFSDTVLDLVLLAPLSSWFWVGIIDQPCFGITAFRWLEDTAPLSLLRASCSSKRYGTPSRSHDIEDADGVISCCS